MQVPIPHKAADGLKSAENSAGSHCAAAVEFRRAGYKFPIWLVARGCASPKRAKYRLSLAQPRSALVDLVI
jgi:hypothetical protein